MRLLKKLFGRLQIDANTELEELHTRVALLEESQKKNTSPESDLNELIRDQKFLLSCITDLLDLSDDEEIYYYIAKKLSAIVPGSIIIVNSYNNETEESQIRSIIASKWLLNKTIKILGRDPREMKFRIYGDSKKQLLEQQLVTGPKGVSELSAGKIPPNIGELIDKLLGIHKIYGMGFSWRGVVYGNAIIITRNSKDIEKKEFIETFIGQVSIVLQRQKAEMQLHQTLERLNEGEQTGKIGYWHHDFISDIVWWSDYEYEIHGLPRTIQPDFDSHLNCIHPDDRERNKLKFLNARDGIKDVVFDEYRIQREDSEIRYIQAHYHVVRDKKGNLIRAFGTDQDITVRKKAEIRIDHLNQVLSAICNINQLIVQEKNSKNLIDKVCNELNKTNRYRSAWIILLDDEHNYHDSANSGFDRNFGRFTEQIQQGRFSHCIEEALRQDDVVIMSNIESACENCPLFSDDLDKKIYTKSLKHGNKVFGFFSVTILKTPALNGDEKKLIEEMANDISLALHNMDIENRRLLAEQALRRSEEMYRSIVENSADAIAMTDKNGKIILLNPIATKLIGKSPENLIGKDISQLFPKHITDDFLFSLNKIIATKKGGSRNIALNLNGRTHHFITNSEPILDSTGQVIAVLTIATNITDLKMTQEKLKEAHTIINRSPVVAFTWKNEVGWPVEYVSDNVERLLGYSAEEIMSKNMAYIKFVHPDDLDRVSAEVNKYSHQMHLAEFEHTPYRIMTKDGVEKIITDWTFVVKDDNDQITHFKGIVYDITLQKHAEIEKEKLKKQLRQAQKLETIGTLAGGIAHDFNNLLTPIIGYTDMALTSLLPTDPLYSDLQEILKGANRAKELVSQILTFSQHIERERKPTKLQQIVKEALKLLRPSIPTTIEIRHRIDESCAKILADPGQIHQVIVNLCTNAYHAMEKTGGTLTIELKQVKIDANTAKVRPNLSPAEYIRLRVSDTGIGMDEATMDRIFDPFFTTKTVNKGTGLGLSVVHGIIRSHNGDILVTSEPEKGSTFDVYLPITKVKTEAESSKIDTILGGYETILVVDDEPSVCHVLKKSLERLNYSVDVKYSSIEALKTIRKKPGKYDLVITDLTMPMLTGLDLSKQLTKINPDLPIILMTGYGQSLTDDIIKLYGIKRVIGKPLTIKEVAVVVRQVLDQ